MSNVLHTKFGNVRISKSGYYQICSIKEGNYGKYLHRLIFEDFYGFLPKDFFIHHKNKNKLDNCILNLQLMKITEHNSIHNKGNDRWVGKKHKLDSKIKMSSGQNSTGYFRVSTQSSKTCKQGFLWKYQWYDENGKRHMICSVSLENLEKKVKSNDLEWRKVCLTEE